MNIYVGNFSYELTEEELREVFTKFGEVKNVKIIKDHYSDTSRGFGFVEMQTNAAAQSAIDGIREIKGRMVVINEARPRLDNGRKSQGRRNNRSW